jgi:ABC-2 type transport system ATP-binding protein
MIEVRSLHKWYGDFHAVDDLSFEVPRGEVVGFLGPNGAGKSTTLRILAGFLGASSGDVRVDGLSVVDEPIEARARIGYMPESCPLYVEMRVVEYLRFRAELKGVPSPKRRSAVDRAMSDAGLGGHEATIIGQLSKGYRQRVGIADALVASPPLLLLDEPTAGLDPNQIREVRDLVKRLSESHTILVSTHILSEVEATCTRAVVIARGKLVASGTIEELRALRRADALRLRLRASGDDAKRAVAGVDGVRRVLAEDHAVAGQQRLRVELEDPAEADATIEAVVRALSALEVGVLEVVPLGSLEDVFSKLTETEPRPSSGLGAATTPVPTKPGPKKKARPSKEGEA